LGDPGPLKKLDPPTDADRKKAAALAARKMAQPWPAHKLSAIKGMTQDRLAALYGAKLAGEIYKEASERGLRWATEDMPKEVAKSIQRAKEQALANDGKVLTDAEARARVLGWRTYDGKASLEPLSILHQKRLAGEPVALNYANTGKWSPDPAQSINAAIPDKPGTYVFAVSWAGISNDPRTTHTLVVEKKADGSQAISMGSFSLNKNATIEEALTPPALKLNPVRDGSRGVLVYPLNPPPDGKK
jgi:hypothetical protein